MKSFNSCHVAFNGTSS